MADKDAPTPIEGMAAHLFQTAGDYFGFRPEKHPFQEAWDLNLHDNEFWRSLSRAALQQLHDNVTPEMRSEGYEWAKAAGGPGAVDHIFQAMLQAAMKET